MSSPWKQQQDRQREERDEAERKARDSILTELLDIADGNCPDHDGGLALVAKALHEHLSSHP